MFGWVWILLLMRVSGQLQVFRIIDAKDGNVDGNLDLARQHK